MDPNDCSDAELIRAAEAEAAAFGVLFERHALRIYRWSRRRLDWAASDLTAETFAQAWLVRHRFRDEHAGSALPWLFGIARNVLRETVRLDRVESSARERLGLLVDLAAEEGYAKVDERLSPRLALAAALDDLPEHERAALELRVVGELPYGEVAERLAIRPAAARLRVSRALRRLAQKAIREDMA